MSPYLADQLFFWAMVVLPIGLILYWRMYGAIAGGLLVWMLGILAGEVLSSLDPNREAAMLDTIWLFAGWIMGFAYAGLLLAIYESIRWLWGRRDQA